MSKRLTTEEREAWLEAREYRLGQIEARGKLADKWHPEGCKCSETDGGGDCDWCMVYYGRVETEEWPNT